MNLKSLLIKGCILFFFPINSFSQKDWVLKLDKEGIKVYTKNIENSALKAVKTVCTIDASLSRLTAVLLDIPGSVDWVYATKVCTLLKRLSPSELVYYSEVAIPWPVSNRDFIIRLKVYQDEKTRAVTIDGDNKPTYLPEKKNIVRIQHATSKWVIVPQKNGQVKIEYVLEVDPGGTVPAWLINLFATKGPFESFKNLRKQLKKPVYNQVDLPFIKD